MRLLLIALFAWNALAISYRYEGNFQKANHEGSECAGLFTPADYRSRLFLLQSKRTVINLDREDGTGFFHGLNLYGLDGGMGDVGGRNEWKEGDVTWRVMAGGIFDYEVLFLNFEVEKFRGNDKKPVCTATAEYAAYSE